jgi:cysteine desulfurase / selenocysteine lyase
MATLQPPDSIMKPMIYLDNAATSFPKPEETVCFLNRFVTEVGGNPGRSGHALSLEAARVIFETREKLTALINGDRSERLIFTQNGTEALNLAILGLLREGDHVITTSLEHNSVMRPLHFLRKERGVSLSVLQASREGILDVDEMGSLVQGNTKALIVNHGSNVIGVVQPLKAIRDALPPDVTLIVDACQTVGSSPIDVQAMGIDILCFSGHKSLLGIQGTGVLYFREGIDLTPLKFGGTGSRSESMEHPSILPDRFECGTPNTPGIAALLGGLTFIEKTGLENIIKRKVELRRMLVDGLAGIDGVTLYGSPWAAESIPVISFNMAHQSPSDVGYVLNREQIFVRVGLQCSPLAHKTIGTFPKGTVRVAPGCFTTDEEIGRFLEVITDLARK